MFNIIVIITAILQLSIGLFVYLKKRNSISNVAFALISVFSLAWATTNYFYTLHPVASNALTIIRLVMFWVVVQNTVFYVFAKNYPSNNLTISRRRLAVVLTASVLVAGLTLTPFVFKSSTIIGGQANPNPGPLIPLFMIHAIYTIGSGLLSFKRKLTHSSGQLRRQFHYILAASILNWVVVPITNFVITLGLHTSYFARISPIYSLVFAGIIAYAMVAQKLFDIRAAVARSAGYVLILGTMSLAYAVLIFGVINVVFKGASHETLRQVSTVILITPLALSFQYIREFFNRITNRLFYRDSYDIQDVLDNLGSIAVSEIDLYRILKDTRKALSDALKSSFVEFVLFKNGKAYFEAHTHKTLSQRLLALGPQVHEQHKDLLVIDSLGPHHPLYSPFHDADVSLSLKLKAHEQTVGYIILGEKRSGDIYTAQDQKLLLIAANELAIAIQNALRFEEIQNFNVTLQARVDEATRRLRHANEKLQALDETKDDFISMASHQLRTPLTSVKGYISMVLEGDAGKISKQQHDMLSQAFFSSQRMVYLIADLLNVSRLKTGKFVIEPTPVNLATMVEEELSQLEETAAARSLKLIYDKPKTFPELMLDETKTRQVIMNFVDNAIYYTPAGGQINVKLIDAPTSVSLRVEDNGIGVPNGEKHHLFTKFYRAGNARKARPDGTGLGLYMAKKVIMAQGGSLIFESQQGKGSTFGFMFGKSKLASSPPKPAVPRPVAALATAHE